MTEKCEPLKCTYFLRVEKALNENTPLDQTIPPSDRIFMKCSAYQYPLNCLNSKRKKLGRT